ncbi:MAG: ABC transporter ATP-binding protein, partial [Clostridiales bacterium]|nr:ABC transporter ATP-binding protein [Clostridiales bacterium]
MIGVKNIFKSFNGGTVEVLKDLSLEIEDGGFTVILGASGSGKTTLMNVVSGLERPDSGEVFYGETNICALNDKELTLFRKENIGFIFQKYYLMPHLSVESNVRLGADLVKNKEYLSVIKAVGLSEKLKRKPCELSGGEQQRVSVARALAKKPNVLFLD